jgi:hypothetical protein
MLHVTTRREVVSEGFLDDTFTLELSIYAYENVGRGSKRINERKTLTFENENVITDFPDVKSPRSVTEFKNYLACGIGKNMDWWGAVSMPIFLGRSYVVRLWMREGKRRVSHLSFRGFTGALFNYSYGYKRSTVS